MSKEQSVETVVINDEQVAGINKENLLNRSKRFAKQNLPKVGIFAAGVAVGVIAVKRHELLADIANSEVIESVSELGE